MCPAVSVAVMFEEEVRKRVRMKTGQLAEDAAVNECEMERDG